MLGKVTHRVYIFNSEMSAIFTIMLLSHFRVMNSLKKKIKSTKVVQPPDVSISLSFSLYCLESSAKEPASYPAQSALPAEVNLWQSSVSLSPAKSLEKILVSYFTQAHPRVIDFSFSECKIDFLSFIPVRTS